MTSELLCVLSVSDIVALCTSYLQGSTPINFTVLNYALHYKDDYYKSCFFDKYKRLMAYSVGVVCACVSPHNTPQEFLADPFTDRSHLQYTLPWRRTAFYQGYNTYKSVTTSRI